MKAKYLWLFAAMVVVSLTGCKQEEPFDTQSADDAPLILKPYNESGTGSFSYDLANPDTQLFDSVTVTPSRYTTVNWYLDGELIFTGVKINMLLPAGSYALRIEAVTESGKSTHRDGSVTVHPYDTDPYSAAPAAGRHAAPGMEVILEGQNMSKVDGIIISKDLFAKDVVANITPDAVGDASLIFTMPAMADGRYFVRLKDSEGKTYGADAVEIHNGAVVLSGFDVFVPGEAWELIGVNLQDVASAKLDDITITELTVTATSVTFTAPAAEVGEHKLSLTNKNGSSVLFITNDGALSEVTAIVSAETTIWEGPVTLDWNADLVKVNKSVMDNVPVGSTIFVYFDVPEAEYHALRITTPWWGDDLVAQIDGMENVPSPYGFEYDDRCKGIVDMVGDMSVVGFGLIINKITFK